MDNYSGEVATMLELADVTLLNRADTTARATTTLERDVFAGETRCLMQNRQTTAVRGQSCKTGSATGIGQKTLLAAAVVVEQHCCGILKKPIRPSASRRSLQRTHRRYLLMVRDARVTGVRSHPASHST